MMLITACPSQRKRNVLSLTKKIFKNRKLNCSICKDGFVQSTEDITLSGCIPLRPIDNCEKYNI